MANKIHVLIEGYAKEIENGWLASSTTTLLEMNDKKIVVDPGCSRPKLLEALARVGLKTADIDYVILTHSHTDHILLDGIFENAKVVTSAEVYDNDHQIDHEGKIPEIEIEFTRTPGHSPDSRSLIVETDEGVYAIAGDLFWWNETEEQKTDYDSLIAHPDPYAKDLALLQNSRKKILKTADYIIPGHGKIFKVSK